MTDSFEAEFNFEKDTKNTYRLQEDAPVPKIGPLYIQKHALSKQPQRVKVTVEVLE